MTDWNFVKTLRDDVHMLYQKFSKVYECFLNTDGSLYTDEELAAMFLDRNDPEIIDKLKEMMDSLKEMYEWTNSELAEHIRDLTMA